MVASSSSNGAASCPVGPLTPGASPGSRRGAASTTQATVACSRNARRSIVPSLMAVSSVERTGRGNGAKLAATRDSRPAMQQIIGGQSDVGKLRRVAVKHARDAFGDAAAVDRQWRDLRYLARPDVTAAWAEYEHFLALLEAAGVDTLRLPPDDTVGLDSLYARDVSIVCDRGVILCNMGKPQRRTEPAAQEAAFRAAGSRSGAASPAMGPWKAETSAGSTSAPWPWVVATGPTMPGSASCVSSCGAAWTRSSWCPCPTGAVRRTSSTSCRS